MSNQKIYDQMLTIKRRFDEFGFEYIDSEKDVEVKSLSSFPFRDYEALTSLYYYGARYLDPTGTTWLSVDPLFEKYVGMSPYGYCAGNPVRLVDVDGRNPVFNEEGELIGVTEDTGLQGDAFFMDNDSYNHKMGKAEAQEKDKGESFLNSEEEIYIYGEKKLKPILPWLK